MGALWCSRIELGVRRWRGASPVKLTSLLLLLLVEIHFFCPELHVYSTIWGCTMYILRRLSGLVICSVARGQDLVALPFNVSCQCCQHRNSWETVLCIIQICHIKVFFVCTMYPLLFGHSTLQWTCCFHGSMTQLLFWKTFGQTSKQKLLFHNPTFLLLY